MMLGMILTGTYWWLMIPGLLLGLYAQFKLRATYRRHLRSPSERGVSGAEAARAILDDADLTDVAVAEVPGELTDHYDPTKRALFLSAANYQGTSLAAVGVAAHEAGHALQHQQAYAPLQWRMTLVPITNFASNAAYGIFMLSMFMGIAKLAMLGVIIFAIITLFQLITLPVEFNASRRAKEQLLRLGLVSGREQRAVGQVLNAAALTYVAAMVSSAMDLLYFFLLARGDDREG